MQIVPVPAVNAVLFNENREVLLTRRSERVREPGKWCLPGGHVELGEKWETALLREVQEECGVTLEAWKFVGLYSDPNVTLTPEPVGGGRRAQFVVALFMGTKWKGKIVPNEEVDDWDWFAIDNLPDPMLKSHPVRVRDALQFRGEAFVR